MLVRDVFKWLLIHSVVICGYSLACHVLMYDFTGTFASVKKVHFCTIKASKQKVVICGYLLACLEL